MSEEVEVMRTIKEPEIRKNEILDVAEELFAVKGFDGTSTNEILEKAGIARGTQYYHFKSKEDILDGVINRMIDQMMRKASEIAANQEVPVLERLTAVILAFHSNTKLGYEVMEQIHKPQNALMHQKMQASLLDGIVPILKDLPDEGEKQGTFHTEYGTEAVEMIILYANTMFDDLAEQDPERKQQRIQGFIYHSERLLGTERGMLHQAIMNIFEKSGNQE